MPQYRINISTLLRKFKVGQVASLIKRDPVQMQSVPFRQPFPDIVSSAFPKSRHQATVRATLSSAASIRFATSFAIPVGRSGEPDDQPGHPRRPADSKPATATPRAPAPGRPAPPRPRPCRPAGGRPCAGRRARPTAWRGLHARFIASSSASRRRAYSVRICGCAATAGPGA